MRFLLNFSVILPQTLEGVQYKYLIVPKILNKIFACLPLSDFPEYILSVVTTASRKTVHLPLNLAMECPKMNIDLVNILKMIYSQFVLLEWKSIGWFQVFAGSVQVNSLSLHKF